MTRPGPTSIPAALAAALLLLAAPAAAAPAPRLVIMDVSPRPLPVPYADLDLAAEVAHTVEGEGCRVERTCRGRDCAAGTPATPAVHVLILEVSYDLDAYSCTVGAEVRDRPGGKLVYKDRSMSPMCPAADVVEHTKRAARVACRELHKAVAVVPAAPAARPLAPSPPWPAAEPPPTRALPLTVTALGAAAVLGGTLLLYLDGRPTSCSRGPQGDRICTDILQTTRVAIPLVLLGAGSAGWGVWRLSRSPARGPALGLGPGGVSASGRF
jgi:hypothetical protein